jgi:hypothetical protein
MDLLSGAAFTAAAFCGCMLMVAVGLPPGAVLAVMVGSLAISFVVHFLWPAGPLGVKVRGATDLACAFVCTSCGLQPVAYLAGGPGMVAAVAVVTGGLAAAGYLLCLAAPLGGQIRFVAGLTAVFFTASAVMAFVMPLAAPFSRDWPPYLGVLPLLEGRTELDGTKSPNSPYYGGLFPPFFTLMFTLGLPFGVHESCKKVTAEVGRTFGSLWNCTLLACILPGLLWLYSEGELRKTMGLRVWSGTFFASALVAIFLFFLATRKAAWAARHVAAMPPSPPAIEGGDDSQDKPLCYLCGKPLEANERAARVCQACRKIERGDDSQDKPLCYLCGKPLEANERAARVCQTCRE